MQNYTNFAADKVKKLFQITKSRVSLTYEKQLTKWRFPFSGNPSVAACLLPGGPGTTR